MEQLPSLGFVPLMQVLANPAFHEIGQLATRGPHL